MFKNFNQNIDKFVLIFAIVMIASTKLVSCNFISKSDGPSSEVQSSLDKSPVEQEELQAIRNKLAKYLILQQLLDADSDEDEQDRDRKSVLLPRIGNLRRSPIIPRIGSDRKRAFHMPRVGRSSLNEYSQFSSEEDNHEKRAIHMPRIGK